MRVSVKNSIIAAAIIMIVIAFAQGTLGLSKLAAVHETTVDLTTNRLTAATVLGEIEAQTIRYRLRTMRFVMNTDETRLAEIEDQYAATATSIADLFVRYDAVRAPTDDRSDWNEFRTAWANYLPLQRIAMESARGGDRTAAIEILEEARGQFLGVIAALQSEIDRNTALSRKEMELAGETYEQARSEVLFFALLTIVVGLLVTAYFVVNISRPMRALTAAMKAVASGRLKTPVPAVDRSDEIGEIAHALVYFRDTLAEAERIRFEQAELDTANLKVTAEAQEAELAALEYTREVLAELAENLDDEVEEKTRHLVEREREIVWRLSRATERRDNDTGAHIVRMGLISGIIAEALGLPEADCRDIEIAAQMHDIGKVGIPDEILFKPGRLTPEERAIMETHATLGWDILNGSESRLIQRAAEVAVSHHEKWDGTGYPNRLAGEAIPLAGRICALADVFDALMAVRPYKRAWSLDEALAFVEQNTGTHFDPACVEAFSSRLEDILAVNEKHREVTDLGTRAA